MTYCSSCGREIPDDAKLCPYCGTVCAKEKIPVKIQAKKKDRDQYIKEIIFSLLFIIICIAPIIPYTYTIQEPYQSIVPKSETLWQAKNFVLPENTFIWQQINIPRGRAVIFEIEANGTTASPDPLCSYVMNRDQYNSFRSGSSLMDIAGYSSILEQVGTPANIRFDTDSYNGDLFFIITNFDKGSVWSVTKVKATPRMIISVSIVSSWSETVTLYRNVKQTKYVSLLQLLTGTQ